ncbi:MAG: hypothetical protein ACYDBY_20085 [Thermoanaerobaculia bacterium]
MRKTWRYAIALLLVVACRRPASEEGRVEVTSDPGEIAAARALHAERHAALLSELLQEPGRIRASDREALDLVRENRPQALVALRNAAENEGAPAANRLEALLAIQLLGEDVAPREVATLACPDTDAALELTSRFWDLYPDTRPLPRELRACVVDWIGSPDRRLLRSALRIVAYRDLPEAADAVIARLEGPGEKDDELFLAAARLRPTDELLTRLEKRLTPADTMGGRSGLDAVCALGKAAQGSALRLRAARVAARHIARQPDVAWIDGATISALEFISTVESSSAARDLLAEVVTSARSKLVRQHAIERIAESDPAKATDLARRTGLELAQRQKSASPSKSMEECARVLVEEAVLARAETDDALAKARAVSADADAGVSGFEALLEAAGRLLAFDVETGMFPNRHDLLVEDLARVSAGRFHPEAVVESYEAGTTESDPVDYRVQFVHGGSLYRFQPKDLGDWYDLDAVIVAVDLALADAGVTERFEMIATVDQTAMLVFAKPEALRKAAGRLGLALEVERDRPFSVGKAYEDRVREALGK